MFKQSALLLLLLPAASLTPLARAQDAQPTVTRTSRLLSHFDLGVSGTALFTKTVNGTVNQPILGPAYPLTQSASTSAGALVTIRAQKSAWKGLELNYGYGRSSQTYSCCNQSPTTGQLQGSFLPGATSNEYTLGYLARPERSYFGFKPYISVGAGSVEFKPTKNGGQGLQPQARAAYYYNVGGESLLIGRLGVRVGVRQLFYKAPDFGQNYLTINKFTFTVEPAVGLYLHF
ncbi:MAG: hypothetical protein ACRYF4_00370 [Janthinobacterium lividum]